jgi:exodeoxyribonuclease-5
MLNAGQERALRQFRRWYRDEERQIFELSGCPGTGKTFLVRRMIEEIGLDLSEVLFCTYTGKAAIALRKNGLNGKTIHSALYKIDVVERLDDDGKPVLDEDGKPIYDFKFIPRKHLDKNIQLIVVDEASMVPENFGKQICKFKVPVLAVGDLNQLGPIFGKPYFLNHPDAILTEIMRQEKGSPIISVAQDILKGRFLRCGNYDVDGIVQIINIEAVKELVDFKNHDAVLCGLNRTRIEYNKYIRKFVYGIDAPLPVIGDKMICRKNNWTREVGGIPLVNGLSGVIEDIDEEKYKKNSMVINFQADDLPASFDDVKIDTRMLNKVRTSDEMDRSPYDIFDYGYAITGHLAQGSQYDSVVVIADIARFKDASRWMYTSVTRAINRLILAI